MCDECRKILSEGLDLCVRARKMDAMDRREVQLKASICGEEWEASGRFDEFVERHNIDRPHAPIATRSGTVMLWIQEQYETDLAEWEAKARKHLLKCMALA